MLLIFMRIIPMSGKIKLSGSLVFRPFTDSDQHSFKKLLCHTDVPKFSRQNKVIKLCPKICIVLLSELIISVPKTDICSSDEIKRCTQLSFVTNMKVAESILFVRLFKGNCGKYFLPLRSFWFFAYSLLYVWNVNLWIKRICHYARFFIIWHGSFQHFTNFLKKKKSLILS